MKKILSIFCVVALLLCSAMIPVSAAGVTVKASSTSKNLAVGSELKVAFKLTGNIEELYDEEDEDQEELLNEDEIKTKAIANGLLAVTYPQDKLTLTKSSVGKALAAAGPVASGSLDVYPYNVVYAAASGVAGNGTMLTLTFTIKKAGDITVTPTFTCNTYDAQAITVTNTPYSVTVAGAEEPEAKTVTYSATNGKVIASLTELSEGTPVASGTITTEAADSDEVYFYFFPDAGYTATGMTVNGEPVIGADGGRKFTITEDKTLSFEFKAVSGTATASAATIISPSVDGVTVFGQATGASDFGAIVGNDKFAADGADGDGYFAIELTGTGIFAAGKTYAAKIYAGTVEGAATTFTID